MTPRKKALVNIGAIIGAIVAVGGWTIRSGAQAVSEAFVHSSQYREDRIRDSLNYRNDVREIREFIAHVDSDIHKRTAR